MPVPGKAPGWLSGELAHVCGRATEIFLVRSLFGQPRHLELLQEIIGLTADGTVRNNLNFVGIFMMAAAVPVSMVGSRRRVASPSVEAPRRCVSIHLRIGSYGCRFHLVKHLAVMGCVHAPSDDSAILGASGLNPKMTGYGHSDYWPRPLHLCLSGDF